MNFISFSPNFPPNYINFWKQLYRKGVNVLGLGDAPYDELLRALGYFTHRYGKIDRIESHNEYWLENDARLRTDFNIQGLKVKDMPPIKRKSEMKKRFIQAGLKVARGRVCKTLEEAHTLIAETGFPVVAKPDIGVGAYLTREIHSHAELEAFFANKPLADFIFEEFVQGTVETFDGLVDQDGNIVFCSSLIYNEGVMTLVNQGVDFWYYTTREVSPILGKYGRKLVKIYDLRERFFHFEFFHTPEDHYVALEVNMRPPGGLTTDMWNYANDIDIYSEYANIVVENRMQNPATHPFFCGYFSRRNNHIYQNSHESIMAAFPEQIVAHSPISGVFAAALGDYGYLARSSELDELREMAEWIMTKA